MAKKNAPTIKDVARAAGVSVGTVSNVINGIAVRKESQRKVQETIEALHYEVNTYARGLKISKSGLVALIVPNTMNPFYATFVDHIEAALYEHSLKLILCCSDEIPDKELEYLNSAKQNKVDGIIALTYSDIGSHVTDGTPIVVFDRFFENRSIPRVGSDNFTGACMAVEKLLELGCRHPVYIRFHSKFPGESDKRRDGYLYTCQRHNLEPDYLDMVDDGTWREALGEFLERHKRSDGSLTFDGVFAHTDFHGYHFMKMLTENGYRVPEDVQLIGFDGIERFGTPGDYVISTMCQPVRQLTQKCVEIILLEDRSTVPSLTLLPVTYCYGGTTREPGR